MKCVEVGYVEVARVGPLKPHLSCRGWSQHHMDQEGVDEVGGLGTLLLHTQLLQTSPDNHVTHTMMLLPPRTLVCWLWAVTMPENH